MLFNDSDDLSTLFSNSKPSLLIHPPRSASPTAHFEGGREGVDRGLLEKRSAALTSGHGRGSDSQQIGMRSGGGASLYGNADELGPMFSSSHSAYGMLMSPPARPSRMI